MKKEKGYLAAALAAAILAFPGMVHAWEGEETVPWEEGIFMDGFGEIGFAEEETSPFAGSLPLSEGEAFPFAVSFPLPEGEDFYDPEDSYDLDLYAGDAYAEAPGDPEENGRSDRLSFGAEKEVLLVPGDYTDIGFCPPHNGVFLLCCPDPVHEVTLLGEGTAPQTAVLYGAEVLGYRLEGGRDYTFRLAGGADMEDDTGVILFIDRLMDLSAEVPGRVFYAEEFSSPEETEEILRQRIQPYAGTLAQGSMDLLGARGLQIAYTGTPWEAPGECEVRLTYFDASFTLLVPVVTHEAYDRIKALSLEAEEWEPNPESGLYTGSFTAPAEGWYTLCLSRLFGEDGEYYDDAFEIALYTGNWEPKDWVQSEYRFLQEETPAGTVFLREGETCFFRLESFYPSVRAWAVQEKKAAKLRLCRGDGEPVLYGTPMYGTWDENGYHFDPGAEKQNVEATVLYEDGTTSYIGSGNYLLLTVEETLSQCRRGDASYRVRLSFLGAEEEIELPLYTLAEYAGDRDRLETGEEVLLHCGDSLPWIGWFTVPEDGWYQIFAKEWLTSFYVLAEEGDPVGYVSEPGMEPFRLEAGKKYFLWSYYCEDMEFSLQRVGYMEEYCAEWKVFAPFFLGELDMGYWDEYDSYLLDHGALQRALLCRLTYEDGTEETVGGEELSLGLDYYVAEDSLCVNTFYQGFQDEVGAPFLAMEGNYESMYPALELGKRMELSYEGRGDGRLTFTAPKGGSFWLSFGGERDVRADVYTGSESPLGCYAQEAGEAIQKQEIPLEAGQTLYLNLYPRDGEPASLWVQMDDSRKPTAALKKPAKVKVKNEEKDLYVSWSGVKNASLYRLYKKTGEGKYEFLALTGERSYTDRSVYSGTAYRYKVLAVGYESEEALYTSGQARASKKTVYLAPCKKARVSKKGRVSWKKVAGATAYEVRCQGGETLTLTVSTTKANLSGHLSGTYAVSVRPVKKVGSTLYAGPWVKAGSYNGK